MFNIALFEPQIAPNTGNIIRLCANNGCKLHLIQPLGFDLEEKKLRRAGLDYHDMAMVTVHKDFSNFIAAMADRRIIACTTKASQSYHQLNYLKEDILLFGAETHGLSAEIHDFIKPELKIKIPMQPTNRSLNLSNAVAIVSYEAWRQNNFIPLI